MRNRKAFVRLAVGVMILALAASWLAQAPERAKVQLTSVVHTNEAGLVQPGWFMVSNPSPGQVICIPLSVQTQSRVGWVDLKAMSATNDPFTYDPISFRFDRVLTEGASFCFTPGVSVSNETWRVTVRCVERTPRDRFSDKLNSNIWKYFPRPGALAKTYSGKAYHLYSSEP